MLVFVYAGLFKGLFRLLRFHMAFLDCAGFFVLRVL